MGIRVAEGGIQQNGDLNVARRSALLAMITLLQQRGLTKAQAYVLWSLAVDLRISNVVDMPNVPVSAFLREGFFEA
jgi:formamidase